jgi:hypothetical protein
LNFSGAKAKTGGPDIGLGMERIGMFAQYTRLAVAAALFAIYVYCVDCSPSQELLRPQPGSEAVPAPASDMPKGLEVQARGPIHEAFASPVTEPKATPLVPKKPPAPIEEMPPEEKPEGDVVWIGGYFAWDDDRADFVWVSGCWRVKPTAKEWVPGYWRETQDRWQWVSGFWTTVQEQKAAPVTYYPEPPAPPNVAPPGDPPRADMIYVPGYWMWNGERYIWRAGYWTPGRNDYVYVPPHYRWTPYGYVFVAGYWDLAIARRGVLYAPVVVNVGLVGPRFVYTPTYAVRDTLVLDCLFVRPAFGAYYFGDYYGPRYVAIGITPGIIYGRRHYEPLMVHATFVYRDNPRWHDNHVRLVVERHEGRAPVPPRTINVTNVTNVTNVKNVTNVTNINNVIAPTKTVLAAQGQKTVALNTAARAQVQQRSVATQQSLMTNRLKTESTAAGPITTPRASALNVHPTSPTGGKSPGSGIPVTKGITGTTNPPATKGITGATPPTTKGTTGEPRTTNPGVGNPMRDPTKGTTPKVGPRPKSDPRKKT